MDTLERGLATFIAYLPNLITGIVLLVIGFVAARLAERGVTRLAWRAGFDRFLARLGLASQQRVRRDGSRSLGTIAFVLVGLAFLLQAFRAFRLYAFADAVARFFLYLPHIFAAALILGAAFAIGTWARNRIVEGTSASSTPDQRGLVGGAVRAGILTLGGFMALQELGIAERIVVIAFTLAFGAIALASALAFGLGGRTVVEQMSRGWYERNRGGSSTVITDRDEIDKPVH